MQRHRLHINNGFEIFFGIIQLLDPGDMEKLLNSWP